MTLRATTLLADNTVPLLHQVCSALSAAGIPIDFDESTDLEQRTTLVEQGEIDLVWACGLLTARLIDAGAELEVVAAPVFPNENQPVYRSVVVCAVGAEYRGLGDAMAGRLAINDLGSWSGWHGLVSYMQESPEHRGVTIPRVVLASGGHVRSIRAVATGEADVAAIDSSVWDYAAGDDPNSVAGLRVLCTTNDWPAPPLSVLSTAEPQQQSSLTEAIAALANFRPASLADYQFMLEAFGQTPTATIIEITSATDNGGRIEP